jgi:hypothetical protein
VLPPDRIGELKDWLRGISADDTAFLTIEPAP